MSGFAPVSLPPETQASLAALAKLTGRSESLIVDAAIRQYCADAQDVLALVTEGLHAAEAGRLIPHAEVKTKWLGRRAHLLD